MPKGIPKPRTTVNHEQIAKVAQLRSAAAVATEPVSVPVPPPAPEPPSPVVLALQDHVLALVNQRNALQNELANANAQLRNAQAAAESARERLQMVEGEVQYRLGLIAQLRGDPPRTSIVGSTGPFQLDRLLPYSGQERQNLTPFDLSRVPQAGMGSIPAQRPQMEGVVGEVRQESAEDMRRAL